MPLSFESGAKHMLQSWKVGQTFLTSLIDTLEADLKRHETKIRARNYLVRVGTKFLHHSFKAKNGHAWEEVSMTVLMYPRLGASREEKKQSASSLTLLGRR